MKYALAFVPVLAIGLSGQAIGGEKPVRFAQSQVSATCMANCNTQYLTARTNARRRAPLRRTSRTSTPGK
jgi:hypothetical protein